MEAAELLLHGHEVQREHSLRQMNPITSSFEDEKKQKAKVTREGNSENLKVSASDRDYLGRMQPILFNHS